MLKLKIEKNYEICMFVHKEIYMLIDLLNVVLYFKLCRPSYFLYIIFYK